MFFPSGTRRQWIRSTLTAAASAAVGGRLLGSEVPQARSVLEDLQEAAEQSPLSMIYSGNTADEALAWQKRFGGKLRELLGPHRPPEKDLATRVETVDEGDYRREEYLLTAEGHPTLPLTLLLPKAPASKRLPGILALHGHGAHGHRTVAGRDDLPGVAKAIASANYDYGRQLARRGYAVAVPCFTPFGVRLGNGASFGKQDPCADTFLRMQIQGRLLMAENLRDALWALHFLTRQEAVDSERLGCVGLSLGGRMTMLTAAIEPRIRVAVVSGALNVLQERTLRPFSCGAQIVPGLLRFGDVPEISGLIAPRHCLWEIGSKDSLIRPEWAERALSRMTPVWSSLGAAENLDVDRFEGGHAWNGNKAYPLLDRVLKS